MTRDKHILQSQDKSIWNNEEIRDSEVEKVGRNDKVTKNKITMKEEISEEFIFKKGPRPGGPLSSDFKCGAGDNFKRKWYKN